MRGAIAAGHPLTAEAGARVLREGGNAVDALLGAVFTAFVTEGPLTGPAGGGFALVHEPGGATTMLDCFFGVPAASLGEMEELVIDFGDSGTQVFHVGDGSVAVPGLLAGLEQLHERFATRPWAELVDPAVALSRAGLRPRRAARCSPSDPERDPPARGEREAHLRRPRARPHRRRLRDPRTRPGRRRGDGGGPAPGATRTTSARTASSSWSRSSSRCSEHDDSLDAVAGRRESSSASSSSSPGTSPSPCSKTRHGRSRTPTGRSARGRCPGRRTSRSSTANGLAAALSSTLGSGSGVFRGGHAAEQHAGRARRRRH